MTIYKNYHWQILDEGTSSKSDDEVVTILLENRNIRTKEEVREFFKPKNPAELSLNELGIDEKQMQKAVTRIKAAIERDEHIIVYGDYDADGVCATAIMWQTLFGLTKHVTPFLPDRFIDGYGLHAESVKRLKEKDPKLSLIVTVDNGIVANDAVDQANESGIDVIISDHHQIGKTLPKAHAIIHTDRICGSGVAWVLGREINKQLADSGTPIVELLDLTAIGTIADQMPLVGANRSFAKHGLEVLNRTKRCGLLALFESAKVIQGALGTYEINYHIAPRINAMGRLENAMDSLRLLCTSNLTKAHDLAQTLGRINTERQKMVEEMVKHAKGEASKQEWLGAIVLAHESYHEGVIGLIASKLVDEYYRPAIVLSKGKAMSKASARSISGFNVIENIRKLDHLLSGGGGHPMAAGFSIETPKLQEFINGMETISKELLTEEVLQRQLQIDMPMELNAITEDLVEKLENFAPIGIGNPVPLFVTHEVYLEHASTVGQEGKHLKLQVGKDGRVLDGIAFGMGFLYDSLSPENSIDIVYSIEKNIWNGRVSTQLKIKDMKIKS